MCDMPLKISPTPRPCDGLERSTGGNLKKDQCCHLVGNNGPRQYEGLDYHIFGHNDPQG